MPLVGRGARRETRDRIVGCLFGSNRISGLAIHPASARIDESFRLAGSLHFVNQGLDQVAVYRAHVIIPYRGGVDDAVDGVHDVCPGFRRANVAFNRRCTGSLQNIERPRRAPEGQHLMITLTKAIENGRSDGSRASKNKHFHDRFAISRMLTLVTRNSQTYSELTASLTRARPAKTKGRTPT